MQDPNLRQESLRFFNAVPNGIEVVPDCNLASAIQRGFKALDAKHGIGPGLAAVDVGHVGRGLLTHMQHCGLDQPRTRSTHLRAFTHSLPLDRRAHVLHRTSQHRRVHREGGRVMFGIVEDELPDQVDVDLTSTLQSPSEPPRCQVVLGTFAAGVGCAANRAERLIEIGYGLFRQTPSALPDRTGNTIDFRGLRDLPLTRLQAVGDRLLCCEEKKVSGRAPGPTRNEEPQDSFLEPTRLAYRD